MAQICPQLQESHIQVRIRTFRWEVQIYNEAIALPKIFSPIVLVFLLCLGFCTLKAFEDLKLRNQFLAVFIGNFI